MRWMKKNYLTKNWSMVNCDCLDFQREMEEHAMGKDEMMALVKDKDKKAKSLEAELLQLHEDMASSERYRRAAEQERDELQEELSNNTTSKYVATI